MSDQVDLVINGGTTVLTEAAPHGTGFLAGVCEAWEVAADAARDAGVGAAKPWLALDEPMAGIL